MGEKLQCSIKGNETIFGTNYREVTKIEGLSNLVPRAFPLKGKGLGTRLGFEKSGFRIHWALNQNASLILQ